VFTSPFDILPALKLRSQYLSQPITSDISSFRPDELLPRGFVIQEECEMQQKRAVSAAKAWL
jgi:hypothetical protein